MSAESKPMTFAELQAALERLEAIMSPNEKPTIQVAIPVLKKTASLGPSHVTFITDAYRGIDWDSRKLFLIPQQPLTTLTESEKNALLELRKKQHNYASYQEFKHLNDKIKRLEKEIEDLVAKRVTDKR